MIIFTSKREEVILADESFASGGEGEVREVKSCPAQYSNVCAKLYFKSRQTEEQARKIRFMVDNPPTMIVGNGMMLAWPLETLHDQEGCFIGFIMPKAFPDSKKLVILTSLKLKKAHKSEWYKFDKELDAKTAMFSRLKLINNIAIPIHRLHATEKYVLKDFKPDNVLVTAQGKITIVDLDSIQICQDGKLLFPGSAATLDYMPPEFYTENIGRDITVPLEKSWDNFAVSEVFYQLLFGLLPYAVIPKLEADENNTISYCIAQNLFPFGENADKIKIVPVPHQNFSKVPLEVQKLFIRAFGCNPLERPQVEEWGRVIHQVVIDVTNKMDLEKELPPTTEKTSSVDQTSSIEQTPSATVPKFCRKCGKKLKPNTLYCNRCGTKIIVRT